MAEESKGPLVKNLKAFFE